MSVEATVKATRLAKVEARIADIEAKYPSIMATKGYSSNNSSGPSKTNQDFDKVAKEYRQLLDEQVALAIEIDQINNAGNGGSYAAVCRRPA